jgi:diaminobutyrate-2-oxoglutarate transaminase
MSVTSAAAPFAEFEAMESNVRYYCRNMPAVFTRARNASVWDENGGAYIDFLSGCGSLNYGHNDPRIKAALVKYLADDGILNSLDLHTAAKRDFLRSFREIILEPRGLPHRVQFTGPTGTNAVEAALKLARKVTKRQTVVAFTNAFHGMTMGSLSVTGRTESRRSAGVALGDVVRLPYDGYPGGGIDALRGFACMLADPSGGIDAPAAFIVEAVQGEGGLNVASAPWLRALADLAKECGALLIVDDIQAGCGRTGTFFSFERSGIVPDLVCLSKSIGGIGLPMALLLIKPEMDHWSPGEHTGTFRGNNLAFVAAAAALEYWKDARFLANVAVLDSIVARWIDETVAAFGPTNARRKGIGLMSGIEFVQEGIATEIAAQAFAKNVLIETCGPNDEVLKFFPPLTIEPQLLSEGLARVSNAILAVAGKGRLPSAA